MDKKIVQKSSKIYSCSICDYHSTKESQYNRHLLTEKHKKKIQEQQKLEEEEKYKDYNYVCNCGKRYKYQSGLSKHKKLCQEIEVEQKSDGKIDENVLLEKVATLMLKQQELNNGMMMQNTNNMMQNTNTILQQQFKQQELNAESTNKMLTNTIKELAPIMSNIGTQNNTNTVNNNQRFNINVFLNEKCKDAMNMSEFIQSIQVSLEQLDFTTNNGLEKGITKIIMDNMNKLDVTQRPLHCTDIKRETLYIKEDDKWMKDKDKSAIKKMIRKASGKNYETLDSWLKDNPKYMRNAEKQRYFARTISNIGKPITDVDDKIIKKLCNENYVKDELE